MLWTPEAEARELKVQGHPVLLSEPLSQNEELKD